MICYCTNTATIAFCAIYRQTKCVVMWTMSSMKLKLTCPPAFWWQPEYPAPGRLHWVFSSEARVAPDLSSEASLGPLGGFWLRWQVWCGFQFVGSGNLHCPPVHSLLCTHRYFPCFWSLTVHLHGLYGAQNGTANLGEGFCWCEKQSKRAQSSRTLNIFWLHVQEF